MRFEEYRRYDAVALADLVGKGEVSAGELLDVAIARAEAVNPKINAIVHKHRRGQRVYFGNLLKEVQREAFLSSNIKFVLIATVVVFGQGVVWYSGQFWAAG